MLHLCHSVYISSAVHKEESPMQDSQGPLVLSSEQSDVLQASSVEPSPSNSSGGTYMWDEDGLEPLEGPRTHPCDGYEESELNSMVSPRFQLLLNCDVYNVKKKKKHNLLLIF